MAVVRVATCAFLFLFTACVVVVSSFVPHAPLTYSRFQGTPLVSKKPSSGSRRSTSSSSSSTSLRMFLGPGNDGGILGIGAPEVFTILMVGYFVLGPSDLYKVVKAVGQGISNLRQLSSDVTKTFENNMESQLQLEELRKAQRELNDAFSFRRSINVNAEAEFNTVNTNTTTTTAETTITTTTTEPTTSESTPPKRKKRKRVKKQVESSPTSVPENLEMPTLDDTLEEERERQLLREQLETSLDDTLIREEEEREQLRRERLERLEKAGISSMPQQQQQSSSSPLTEEQERFAQQLSGNWNEYILQNEEKLSPLSKIMERLAILEEEKKAADARLEEEFRLRANVEERYYQQKRAILEEAATELQAEAYVSMTTTTEEEKKRTA